MTYYVSRWPDKCDPRDGYMGHEQLNGIQTPPARIFFEDRGPPTVISNWTYQGILGPLTALPELFVELITPGCEPRNVIWASFFLFDIDMVAALLLVEIVKFDRSLFTVDPWDSYWIRLHINNVPADAYVEHRVTIENNYSIYQNNTPGLPWIWSFEGTPYQAVSWTEAFPCAWDRDTPGPPFPNNPPP